jgi:DNA-binding beta-propeller fold protein YncE
LQALATAVSDPVAPSHGQFLTTEQFAAEFGATSATIGAVEAALESEGLSVDAVSANALVLSVHSTFSQAADGLQTGFDLVRLPGGRLAYANTRAPRLPTGVASSVQAIIGLNTLPTVPTAPPTATPQSGRSASPAVAGPTPCAAAVTAANQTGGWTENQLAQAYSLTGLYAKGQLGAKTTIALFELDPYAAPDITAFQSCYRTTVPVTKINVDGGDGTGAGEGEATLDIETAIGLAPQASLRVYEAPAASYAQSTVDEYTRIITDNKAQIISSSYGLCEPIVNALAPGLAASENTLFQEAATQGISTFVASGDTGSAECYPNGGVDGVALGNSSQPVAVDVDPSFHTAYVADLGTGNISVIDDANQSVVKTLTIGAASSPSSVSVDPSTHQVFVALSGTDQVAELSAATCNASTVSSCTLKRLKVGTTSGDVQGVAANPTTGTVYVSLEAEGKVAAVRESNLSLVGKITSHGNEPFGLTVNRSTNKIFVGNFSSNDVAKINGVTCDAATATGCSQTPPVTGVGVGPAALTVDEATNQVFVVDAQDSSLWVLNGGTGAVQHAFDLSLLASTPADVALSPDGAHLLIPANFAGAGTGQAGVIVVQISNFTITGMLDDTGAQPFAVASDASNDVVTEADPQDGAAIFLPLGLAVNDPSSQPFVTSVGGTDLSALGPKPTESTWNEAENPACGCQEGAGTGGISTDWTMPTWQMGPGVVSSLSSGAPCAASSGDCREVPDVSASADPVHGYVIFHGGAWTSVGGTSAATPLWAALLSVIESKSATPVRQGFLNPRLYTTASAHGAAAFNDVTVGTNDYVGIHDGLYPATSRFDMATGLGSPVATGIQSFLPPPS